MNDQNSQQKNKKRPRINPKDILGSLETLGSEALKLGEKAVQELGSDLLRKIPGDAVEQITGKKISGTISEGESVRMEEVYSSDGEKKNTVEKHVHYERIYRQKEFEYRENRANELRMELKAIMNEVQKLAESTEGLAENLKIAVMQAPIEPGIYHIIFFQNLIEFIHSFRLKINEASVWLAGANKRAQKKSYWGMYKKHKGSFLLSSEHYIARSAG